MTRGPAPEVLVIIPIRYDALADRLRELAPDLGSLVLGLGDPWVVGERRAVLFRLVAALAKPSA